MLGYVVRRVLWAVPVMWLAISLTFFAMKATGKVSFALEAQPAGGEYTGARGVFDPRAPLYEQYVQFLGHAARFDWGESNFYDGEPVKQIVADGFPITARIGLLAFLIALGLGVPVGVKAALDRDGRVDRLVSLLSTVSYTIPTIILSFLALLVVVDLHIPIPVLWDGGWRNYVLPSLVLGLSSGGYLARLTKASTLEVLGQDYVRTARAKGLRPGTVTRRHILRNALIPVVALVGPTLAMLITGSVLVEYAFQIPGTGHMLFDGFAHEDFALVLAATMIYTLLVLLANLGADIAYGIINPRVRMGDAR